MSARSLLIGLDGADAGVIERFGPSELPTLHSLMARGAWARLRSVVPFATLPNWTTLLTGVDPGTHGVFDFTIRKGYSVEFAAGSARAVPTIAARLDRLGLACALLFFPATWPPERLRHGAFVSGWDSPVAFEADRSFVWPPSLHDVLRARFGPLRFDDVDELAAERPGWHERLPGELEARIERKLALAEHLLASRAWDLFAFYFGESDTASHHLWALCDPESPRHPRATGAGVSRGLLRVYRALDAAVSRLVERAGPDVELTIASDHGSGGAGDKVLYLDRALAHAGLLAFRDRGLADRALALARDRAVAALPPRVRQLLFRMAGRALPGRVESAHRFGAIDFARTRAFSEELNYFPSVCLNVKGREPKGTVEPRDVPRVRDEVRAALLALRDPWSGAEVVREVHDRESLYRGPHVERAPDLILELALDGAYSYNLMPSGGAGAPWRRLDPSEHLGRKGRSLQGSHRPRGLLVMAGPRVEACGEIDARMADVTATLLSRLGIDPGPDLHGRVLREALRRGVGLPSIALPSLTLPHSPAPEGDRTEVEERLRALGYID